MNLTGRSFFLEQALANISKYSFQKYSEKNSQEDKRSSAKSKLYNMKKMSVLEFVLFSVTLRASSASSVFSNFTPLLLLCTQSSIAWSWRKKTMVVFLFSVLSYIGEVYYERTVQVECPVHILLSAKSQQKCNAKANCSKYWWNLSVDFSKVIILNRSTKGAISSSLILS